MGDVRFASSLVEVGGERNPDEFARVVAEAVAAHDSVGGVVECRAAGAGIGLGEPFFDSAESVISHLMFSVPAVKGIEFGSGFGGVRLRGSERNDRIADAEGHTFTNNEGGIVGGITNGNEIVVRVALKPTPSIAAPQQTFDFAEGCVAPLCIRGRHDACIALRASVVVEAAVAIALADLPPMSTRRETVRLIASAIAPLYDPREAESIARMVVMEALGVDFTHLVADYDAPCAIEGLDDMVADLRRGRPVQYVLGHAGFCGFDFAVREGVLIPRPETAELVGRIAAATAAGARILDVGTGSGAIAVSLARMIPDSSVAAVDISEEALAVARENAARNGAEVDFRLADALGDLRWLGTFDAIVSNPPKSFISCMCS